MRNIKIKETYLLILIVLGLISLSLYSTFALFTASTEIKDVVGFEATLTSSSNILEYEMVTLAPDEIKIIELSITNSYTSPLYYGAWYEIVSPTNTTGVSAGLFTEKDNTSSSGQIASGESITLIAGIKNNSTETAVVNIGTVGSLTSSLGLTGNRLLLPEGWVDAIVVTDEVLAENTTTTDTAITTKNFTTAEMTKVTLNPGTYKLEVWGAQGGKYTYTSYGVGGKGGYSYGTLTLTETTDLFVYVGGKGSYASSSTYTAVSGGGFNGGGNAGYRGGGGGGASDIRIGTDSLYARVIVAGGGGGAHSKSSTYYADGGAGGGTNGLKGSYTSSNYTTFVGQGGTQTAGGSSGTGVTSGNYNGKDGTFGVGGDTGYKYNNTSYYSNGAGGGGWYGGGAADNYASSGDGRASGGGGGSGYVYTSSTASNYPSGCLLNSKYYLTNAKTVAGNTSFTDYSGSTVTGHSGNGAARISGTQLTKTYSIPRVLGLNDISINIGDSVSLTSGVTVECESGKTGCTLVGPSITNTSTLSAGEHTIYYTVKTSDGTSYKYPRKVLVDVSALEITNILVNNNINQGIPTTGYYSLTSNCSNATYDPLRKEVSLSNFTGAQSCQLNFTTSTSYPLLNTMQVGDYVAYEGNNGCNKGVAGTTGLSRDAEAGNSCLGENANQSVDTSNNTYGYCTTDAYKYYVYGWRIAYIENNKVHLISAGAPECRTRTSSTGNATQISDLNTAARDYCNSKYADGGSCSSSNTWAMGNADFQKITYAISGTTSNLTSAYGSPHCNGVRSMQSCGYNNDLIDNGGYYYFAAYYTATAAHSVVWLSEQRELINSSVSAAYGLRPVIKLSSSVYVTGGTGTMEDPYTIGI